MKTKIINTIHQWVPESDVWVEGLEALETSVSDYLILRKMSEMCVTIFDNNNSEDLQKTVNIINVISILYQGGNQYTRNAIENEFLTGLSTMESPGSLKKHMDLFPTELRKGYLKTILEN